MDNMYKVLLGTFVIDDPSIHLSFHAVDSFTFPTTPKSVFTWTRRNVTPRSPVRACPCDSKTPSCFHRRVQRPHRGALGDLDVFEALFKPLSSSPTLRFVASRHSRSPFPPSLSLLSPVSTPELLTPDLLPEPQLEVTQGYANAPALPRPTRSWDTSSAPATPTTPQGLTFPFPSIRTADDAEAAPVTPRLHLHPNPRPRIRFRTLSASITACCCLSLSEVGT
jgi:hypothetical protein